MPPVSRRANYNFFIPSTLCGTIQTDARLDGTVGFKNVIIIQNDPEYQEVWDMARKISCDWVTRIDKYVTFAPFGVDMLGIKEIAFPGDTVDCWMDIQRGHGPFAPTIAGVVPIGEKLTIVIYIRDKDSSFDIHVKDCYAYDSPDYKRPGVRAIQLTDVRGCPIKEKLVKGFYRTRDVRNSGATIIAYGVINAFKFPEAMDVFLACNVEVCKGGCENPCQPEVSMAGGDADDSARGPFTRPPPPDVSEPPEQVTEGPDGEDNKGATDDGEEPTTGMTNAVDTEEKTGEGSEGTMPEEPEESSSTGDNGASAPTEGDSSNETDDTNTDSEATGNGSEATNEAGNGKMEMESEAAEGSTEAPAAEASTEASNGGSDDATEDEEKKAAASAPIRAAVKSRNN